MRRQGLSECLCSHQSMVCAQDGYEGSAHTSWSPTAQVDRGGLVEFDDWILRRGRPPPPVPSGSEVKSVKGSGTIKGSGPMIPLDTVRCAGYDSVFVPRLVSRLKDDKLKEICKIASLSTAKASSVSIDASLRQLVASLARVSNASSEQTTEDTESALEPEAGKFFRLGGASMGCKCSECVSDAEEAAKEHATWNKDVMPKFKRLPEDVQKELNPSAVAHYDHYVIYDNRQALPRYLIKFTVKELPPPEPAPPEPCWMRSDPPDRIVFAQTKVFINLTVTEKIRSQVLDTQRRGTSICPQVRVFSSDATSSCLFAYTKVAEQGLEHLLDPHTPGAPSLARTKRLWQIESTICAHELASNASGLHPSQQV